jgi:hypothetical protein
MWKRLAILGLLMGLMPALTPVPGQTVKPSAQSGDNDKNHSQSKQSAAAQSLAFINKPEQPPASNTHSGNVASEDKEQSVKLSWLPPVTITDKQKTFWDYFFDWGPWVADALLAIVGILQVILLFRTWKTIERQADMQQASMMQWVDIQPIETIVKPGSASGSPEIFTLTLRWKIVNNTPLPFTIRRVETHLCKDVKYWEIFVVDDDEIVPPARDGNRNFYPFFLEVDLNESETKEFLEKGILVTIQIEVSYVDATGRSKKRFLGDHYLCDKNTLAEGGFWPGKVPEKRIEKDDSPSTIRAEKIEVVEWVEVPNLPQDAPKETEQQPKGQNQPSEPEKPN